MSGELRERAERHCRVVTVRNRDGRGGCNDRQRRAREHAVSFTRTARSGVHRRRVRAAQCAPLLAHRDRERHAAAPADPARPRWRCAAGRPGRGDGASREGGTVTVRNPCLSGGAIEIFLEPVLPAPRVPWPATPRSSWPPEPRPRARIGDRRRAGHRGRGPLPRPADLALVVAVTGRTRSRSGGPGSSRPAGHRALASPSVPWPCQPSSAPRVSPRSWCDALDAPVGIDIAARTPGEIALSILARIIAVRRRAPVGAPASAVDPSAA